MRTMDAFANPDLEQPILETTENIMSALTGQHYTVGLGAMMQAFIIVCQQAKLDPSSEFESVIAAYEGRKPATHRGSQEIN